MGLSKEEVKDVKFYKAKGCPACNNIVYIGRTVIYEVMTLNEELRQLIVDKAIASELRNAALKYGMKILRNDGFEKIKRGFTTLEEVLRETTGYQ